MHRPGLAGERISLAVRELGWLQARLERLHEPFAATCCALLGTNDGNDVRRPWENRLRYHAPHAHRVEPMSPDIACIQIIVPTWCDLAGIVRFHRRVRGAKCALRRDLHGHCARDALGAQTRMLCRGNQAKPVKYEGQHIQINLACCVHPDRKFLERARSRRNQASVNTDSALSSIPVRSMSSAPHAPSDVRTDQPQPGPDERRLRTRVGHARRHVVRATVAAAVDCRRQHGAVSTRTFPKTCRMARAVEVRSARSDPCDTSRQWLWADRRRAA